MSSGAALRVAVVGAGAVGSFVGTRLAIGGGERVKVCLIGRDSLVKAVQGAGDTISSRVLHSAKVDAVPVDGDRFRVTTDGEEALTGADVVVVSVKSISTEEVAKDLAKVLNGCGLARKSIVSIQNGVANPRILDKYLGLEHDVVPALLEFNVTWDDGALFQQQSEGVLLVEKKGQHWSKLKEMVEAGSVGVKASDSLLPLQYGKLIINLNNAVNALSSVPLLTTFKDDDYRHVLSSSIHEASRVFKQANIPVAYSKPQFAWLGTLFGLPRFIFNFVLSRVIKISPEAKLSMLQDLEKGRRTEIDFINGEVLRVAEEHNLPDPVVNRGIVELIKQAEADGPKPPHLPGRQVREKCKL